MNGRPSLQVHTVPHSPSGRVPAVTPHSCHPGSTSLWPDEQEGKNSFSWSPENSQATASHTAVRLLSEERRPVSD